jgi:hypothetical protein
MAHFDKILRYARIATKQVVMVAAWASMKNSSKIGHGEPIQQKTHIVRWAYLKQG